MSKHDQLMKANFISFTKSQVVNLETEAEEGHLVFNKENIHPDFQGLVQTSPLLYQTLFYQKQAIEALLEVCQETAGAGALIEKFEQMIEHLNLALVISLEGIDAYFKESKH